METTRDKMNTVFKEISTPAAAPSAEPTSPLISSKQKTYNTITDGEDDEHVEDAVSDDDNATAVEGEGGEASSPKVPVLPKLPAPSPETETTTTKPAATTTKPAATTTDAKLAIA